MYKIYDEYNEFTKVLGTKADVMNYKHPERYFIQVFYLNRATPLPWTFTDTAKLAISEGFGNIIRWGRCSDLR